MDPTTRPQDPFPKPKAAAGGNPADKLNEIASGAHKTVDSVATAADEALRKAKPGIEKVSQSMHGSIDRAAGTAMRTASWVGHSAASLKQSEEQLLERTAR